MKTVSMFLFALWLCLQPARAAFAASNPPDLSVTVRTVTEDELVRLGMENRAPELNACLDILSRLNTEEPFYILRDMRRGKKLKAPVDFNAYRNWTPLPARLPVKFSEPRFIMVVKDLGFIGWYEHGQLVGDSQACFGTQGQKTVPGLYRVDDKDAAHTSSSYRNDYGEQAWMPFSLHIYEAVWIHAGNVFGLRCSHGCITLPYGKAEKLYGWARKGTPVLVADDLKEVCGGKGKSEPLKTISVSKSSIP
ncbi:MAG: L,D-transpeptidase [Syntrophobacteraceae bacterium]|nr:L,D-transpeptidase [Syntrophobacteraceae bacterium]